LLLERRRPGSREGVLKGVTYIAFHRGKGVKGKRVCLQDDTLVRERGNGQTNVVLVRKRGCLQDDTLVRERGIGQTNVGLVEKRYCLQDDALVRERRVGQMDVGLCFAKEFYTTTGG
jgi:hypothetical protein